MGNCNSSPYELELKAIAFRARLLQRDAAPIAEYRPSEPSHPISNPALGVRDRLWLAAVTVHALL